MRLSTTTEEVCLKLEGYRKEGSIVGDGSPPTVGNIVQFILLTRFVKEEKLEALLLRVRKGDITITTTTIQMTSQF